MLSLKKKLAPLSQETSKLLDKTKLLSINLRDENSLSEIKKSKSAGKRIKDTVSATLIIDTLNAFDEYCAQIKREDVENYRHSLSLLTRYIYESYVTFLYIFNATRGRTNLRTKAFYYFGEYKRKKILIQEDETADYVEWKKFVPKKTRNSTWSGGTFSEIVKELNLSTSIYEGYSLFTHPGIFTLERVVGTDMFRGFLYDSAHFTSASICNLLEISIERKLCGIEFGASRFSSLKTELNQLAKIHDQLIKKV